VFNGLFACLLDPNAPNVVVTKLTLVCTTAPGPLELDLTGELGRASSASPRTELAGRGAWQMAAQERCWRAGHGLPCWMQRTTQRVLCSEPAAVCPVAAESLSVPTPCQPWFCRGVGGQVGASCPPACATTLMAALRW